MNKEFERELNYAIEKEVNLLKRANDYSIGKTLETLSVSIDKSLDAIYHKMIDNFYSTPNKYYRRHSVGLNKTYGTNLHRSIPYKVTKHRSNGFAIYSFSDFAPDANNMEAYHKRSRKKPITVPPSFVLGYVTGVTDESNGWRFFIPREKPIEKKSGRQGFNLKWNLRTQNVDDEYLGHLTTRNARTIKRGFDVVTKQINRCLPSVGAELKSKYFNEFIMQEKGMR